MTSRQFNFSQLALMDWLMEKPGRRFFVRLTGINLSASTHLYEREETPEGKWKKRRVYPRENSVENAALLDRLGGRENIRIDGLVKEGFLNAYSATSLSRSDAERTKKFLSQFENLTLQWYETIYVPTKVLAQYWAETGRDIFSKLEERRLKEREAVSRLVVLGVEERIHPSIGAELAARLPKGINPPIPARRAKRPRAVARVVKESTERLYITDVVALPEGTSYYSLPSFIHGRSPNQYVSKDAVLVDYASMETARKLVEIDAEYEDELNSIANKEVGEMLPFLQRLADRLLQKDAEREDMIREVLDGERNSEHRP